MQQKLIKAFGFYKYLLLIVFLAAILRFVFPGTPPSLNWDEISHGYNAYSILSTGKDEWGKTFPIIFRAYGDYKLPVYIYLTAISELFFGLSTFAVRLPSILAGIGTVIFTYFLVLELFSKMANGKRQIANTAALLAAIEPWSLFASRAAFEANLALFFFVSGTYFFVRAANSPITNHKSLITSASLLGVTVWTYNSYRIFTTLIVISLVIIYWKELRAVYRNSQSTIYKLLIVLAIFFVPMFVQLFNPVGQARYSWVGILDQGSINKINEARGMGCSRFVCNKYSYIAKEFSKNYISHFSPNYLFFKGGTQYQFNVPNAGLLYIVNLPLFYLGIAYVLINLIKSLRGGSQRPGQLYLILILILLAPIPSSLTREAPHVLRSITFLPIPMVLSALGFYSLNTVHRSLFTRYKSICIFGYLIVCLLFLENYLLKYFSDYTVNYSQSWQYGYKEADKFIKENYSKYDKIIFTKKYGEPHEFLLFDLKWNSNDYTNDKNLNRFAQSNWFWVDGFDKFFFVNDWDITEERVNRKVFTTESKKEVDCRNSLCLLVVGPSSYANPWKKIKTINFLDSKTAFEIYENK